MCEELTGKAIQVDHFMHDELWDLGPKEILDEINLISADAFDDAGNEDKK